MNAFGSKIGPKLFILFSPNIHIDVLDDRPTLHVTIMHRHSITFLKSKKF